MTKFKEYLRAKGILLECDFDVFPNMGIHHVETHVLGNYLEVLTHYTDAYFPDQVVFDNAGTRRAPSERLYEYDAEALNGLSDYVDFLRGMGYIDSDWALTVMQNTYEEHAKVRIAFKHMKAGLMDERTFCKLALRYRFY